MDPRERKGSSPPPLPFRLLPAPVERIWGGSAAARLFGWRPPASKTIGEWWLMSFRREHPSIVAEGPFEGKSLPDVAAEHPGLLGGDSAAGLLVKVIDAGRDLSVQVHPDDRLARSMGLDSGKTECWYFLKSAAGARIYRGLKPGQDPEDFLAKAAAGLEPDQARSLLRDLPVLVGRLAFIPAGMIHAVGEGALLLEVQQDSDTTFRIYDWGRPREIHLDAARRALKAAAEEADRQGESRDSRRERGKGTRKGELDAGAAEEEILLSCPFFSLSRFRLMKGGKLPAPNDLYACAVILEGRGRLETAHSSSVFREGDCYFLPARSPAVTVKTKGRFTAVVCRRTVKMENEK